MLNGIVGFIFVIISGVLIRWIFKIIEKKGTNKKAIAIISGLQDVAKEIFHQVKICRTENEFVEIVKSWSDLQNKIAIALSEESKSPDRIEDATLKKICNYDKSAAYILDFMRDENLYWSSKRDYLKQCLDEGFIVVKNYSELCLHVQTFQ